MANEPKTTTFSLTEHEYEIVKRASMERGLLNRSATLRQIIREWDEMNRARKNNYPYHITPQQASQDA